MLLFLNKLVGCSIVVCMLNFVNCHHYPLENFENASAGGCWIILQITRVSLECNILQSRNLHQAYGKWPSVDSWNEILFSK